MQLSLTQNILVGSKKSNETLSMIPLIFGAIALGTAAVGAMKGTEGISHLNEAKEIGERAQTRHKKSVHQLRLGYKKTNNLAEAYGQIQLNIKIKSISRFIDFLRRIDQTASQSDLKYLAGIQDISVQQIQEYKSVVKEAELISKGIFSAAATGAATGYGAVGLVGLFGTASTGAAISGLAGAAATNATLAWLGGGALATGGGGMALGSIILGGIAVGPALAVGGFVLAAKGEEALTDARKYDAEINIEILKIKTAEEFLQKVDQQIIESRELVKKLNSRVVKNLEELELWLTVQETKMTRLRKILNKFIKAMPTFLGWLKKENPLFKNDEKVRKIQQTALLVKALADIIQTPILDKDGDLNSSAMSIQAKYSSV
jgi:CHAD domain-containing protein